MNPALNIERGFALDPSCKLWMPFYKYGYELKAKNKFPDHSGNNNHGTITGAAPASYPLLSGVELATNGTFTGSAAGWTVGAAWAYAANAVNKNADGTNTLSQTLSIIAGHRYRINYWLSNWTVGTVTPTLGGTAGSASGAANGYYESIIIATDTTDLIFTPTNTSRFTIDTISIQEVVGYESLGWGFDGVDDQISIASIATLSGDCTILTWARPQQTNHEGTIVSLYGAGGSNYLLTYDNRGWFTFSNNGIDAINSNNSMDLWTMIGGVINTSINKYQLYKNGIYINQSNLGNATTAGPVWVGSVGGAAYLYGQEGEAIIFNRVLSIQEISNYYELTRHIFGG